MSFFLENTPIENGYYSIPDLPSFSIVGSMPITAKISVKSVEIFSGTYTPNNSNRVEIDFKDILSSLLDTTDPQLSVDNFEQSEFLRDIKVNISDEDGSIEKNFHIVNINAHCNIDLLQKRFLTLQPDVKPTTTEAQEFLTYFYMGDANKLVVKFYYDYNYCEVVTLYKWDKATPKAVTHNVSCKKVLACSYLSSEHKKPFYDIYIVNDNNERISMVQRYVFSEATERDRYYLYCNSMGGIDTIIANGSLTEQPEVTYDLARNLSGLISLDSSDDHILYKQSSGNFAKRFLPLFKDFILSKRKKYVYENNTLSKIVLTHSDPQFNYYHNLISFTFDYRKDNDIIEVNDIDIVTQNPIVENLPDISLIVPKKGIIVHNNAVPCTIEPIECTMNYVLMNIESMGTIKILESDDKVTWNIIDEVPGNGQTISMAYEDVVVGSWLKVESDKPITYMDVNFSNADHTLMLWSNDDVWINNTIWN